MEEGPKPFTPKESESIEEKKQRLMPIFQKSLDVFCNPEVSNWQGVITVNHREPDGMVELVSDLVCIEINKDGPTLAWIDEEGKQIASATMPWEEIIDAKI